MSYVDFIVPLWPSFRQLYFWHFHWKNCLIFKIYHFCVFNKIFKRNSCPLHTFKKKGWNWTKFTYRGKIGTPVKLRNNWLYVDIWNPQTHQICPKLLVLLRIYWISLDLKSQQKTAFVYTIKFKLLTIYKSNLA